MPFPYSLPSESWLKPLDISVGYAESAYEGVFCSNEDTNMILSIFISVYS